MVLLFIIYLKNFIFYLYFKCFTVKNLKIVL